MGTVSAILNHQVCIMLAQSTFSFLSPSIPLKMSYMFIFPSLFSSFLIFPFSSFPSSSSVDFCYVILNQEEAEMSSLLLNSPPFDCLQSFYHVSYSNKRHLLLLDTLPLSFSLFLSVSLSFSGDTFLSAFYSKSNRRASIEPKLRQSGYISPDWYREMLYPGRRARARQSDREEERETHCAELMLTDYKNDESGC